MRALKAADKVSTTYSKRAEIYFNRKGVMCNFPALISLSARSEMLFAKT